MNYFISTKTRYQAISTHRSLTSLPIRAIFVIALGLSIIGWSTFMLVAANPAILGLTIILTAIALGAALPLVFAHTYFDYLKPRQTVKQVASSMSTSDINVAAAMTHDCIDALGPRARTPQKKHSLAESMAALIASPHLSHFWQRMQIDPAKMWPVIETTVIPDLTWQHVAQEALNIALKMDRSYIEPEHVLGALLLHPRMRAQIRTSDFTERDIEFALWWEAAYQDQARWRRRWWDAEKMLAFTGVGMSWASGFTPFVDQFTRLPKGNVWDDMLFGHEEKVDELINTLARQRQSNVLLVGDPGVGRIGIIRELARRIANAQAHPDLNGQRVLYINIGELLAQAGSDAKQMTIVSRALREMERAGNIVAIIDGLSSALGSGSDNRINLTDILSPFLAAPTIRVVVITSSEEYHLRMKSNQELIHYFEVVQVPSLSVDNTMKRLALTIPRIESRAKLYIPYKTIRTLVVDTASILPQIPFPERAYDFLEEAIVLAQKESAQVLEDKHIHTIIQHKIGINLGEMRSNERTKLLNLGEIMHQRLVNQDIAVASVTKALVRARAEVRSQERPIGTFLFLGPTGVGKTETAKTLAQTYFGSEDHMVRLDMSEFQGTDGVARLIGSNDQRTGRLTSLISDHPFTVVLLDEFEKASSQVHQLFLQVLDEGYLTDAAGRKYSFLHTIIIATSNAGAELIRQTVKDGPVPAGFEQQLKDHILSNNLLRPELLNRFDDVITFTPLTIDHIRQIAGLMIRSLNKRLDSQHGVTVVATDELIDFLVSIGYNPEFGARPMTRAIQDTVEYEIAQRILRGEVQPGDQITLHAAELQVLTDKG